MTPDQWQTLSAIARWLGPTTIPILLAFLFKPKVREWVLNVLKENRPDVDTLVFDALYANRPAVEALVISTLQGNRAHLKQIIDQEYAVAIKERDEARQIITEHSDTVEFLSQAVELQGKRLSDVERETRDIPHFTGIATKLTSAIEDMTKEFGQMRVTVARIDERQRMAWPDIDQRANSGRRAEDTR